MDGGKGEKRDGGRETADSNTKRIHNRSEENTDMNVVGGCVCVRVCEGV